MKDLSRESIREKLKRISKPDTTWIKKAKKRAGIPEVSKDTDTLRSRYKGKIHFVCEEGDEAFTDGYVLWLEDKLINKNDRL